MALTDTAVKNAKAKEKNYKIFDGRGLYLEVTTKGAKRWRFKYRYLGKEKLLSLGIYPDVKLKKARIRRDELREQLADGVDPSIQRKIEKAAKVNKAGNSFEVIGREWLEKHKHNWVASYSERLIRRLEKDVFPYIGKIPVTDITPVLVLGCVRRIEERGAIETAHRTLQNCGQIMRYAVATARAQRDPCSDLRGALPPSKAKHFAAITDPDRVGELLRAIDSFEGTHVCRCALKLAPLVFVRPGELRHAKWKDIDFKKKEWSYIVPKTQTQHIVPLSKQAIAILKDIHPLTHESDFVFPSARSFKTPMSDNAILAALRRMEIPKEEMTGHGFRAMARTLLDEVLEYPPHLIEHQLAHAVRDPNGRAYNRTAHLPQRRKMMQAWADYLDELKVNKKLLKLVK